MKKLFPLLALMMISTQLFAQTEKVYLTKSGKFTSEADKASGYLLVQKLGNEGYQATQYDMRNNMVSNGTYKDEELNVPSGKFVYYSKQENDPNIYYTAGYKPEKSNYYLSSAGYYVNGKREGIWTEYSSTGEKKTECTYENGVLNGSYKVFNGNFTGVGTNVNGKLDGKFDWYTNGLLAAELYYENGKLKSKTQYLEPAKEYHYASLSSYLYKALNLNYAKEVYGKRLTLKYTVDVKGKITNAQIVEGYTPEVNQEVLAKVAQFDGMHPATYNGKPIAQEYTETFYLFDTRHNLNAYDYGAHDMLRNPMAR